MTEQEAKTKWCPKRLGVYENYNGDVECGGVSDTSLCCIGSGCMMWRWLEYCPECRNEEEIKIHGCKNQSGYCGLGGKP